MAICGEVSAHTSGWFYIKALGTEDMSNYWNGIYE
jgi:hypothetical protein